MADKPLFKPSDAGPALSIDTVTEEILIENVSFEVGDATGAGATALTALVNASPSVTLRSVSLTAGEGQPGENGSLTNFTFPNPSTLNGNPENPVGEGGASKKCECQATLSTTGGVGGTPVDGGQAGSKGQPDHGGGAAGDNTKACNNGGGGGDGNDAPARPPAPENRRRTRPA